MGYEEDALGESVEGLMGRKKWSEGICKGKSWEIYTLLLGGCKIQDQEENLRIKCKRNLGFGT